MAQIFVRLSLAPMCDRAGGTNHRGGREAVPRSRGHRRARWGSRPGELLRTEVAMQALSVTKRVYKQTMANRTLPQGVA